MQQEYTGLDAVVYYTLEKSGFAGTGYAAVIVSKFKGTADYVFRLLARNGNGRYATRWKTKKDEWSGKDEFIARGRNVMRLMSLDRGGRIDYQGENVYAVACYLKREVSQLYLPNVDFRLNHDMTTKLGLVREDIVRHLAKKARL